MPDRRDRDERLRPAVADRSAWCAGRCSRRLLMADEINRTPPKTQAALLEAMQERQVTIDGASHRARSRLLRRRHREPGGVRGHLSASRGAARSLPAADRDGPARTRAPRSAIYQGAVDRPVASGKHAPRRGGGADGSRDALRQRVPPGPRRARRSCDYLARLADAVRRSPHVEPRGQPAGRAGAARDEPRARALLAGRDFVLPDDMKRFLVPCWASPPDPEHRNPSWRGRPRARSWKTPLGRWRFPGSRCPHRAPARGRGRHAAAGGIRGGSPRSAWVALAVDVLLVIAGLVDHRRARRVEVTARRIWPPAPRPGNGGDGWRSPALGPRP